MDDDYDTTPPRRALRIVPSRAAKIKTPVRKTRSTAAYFSSQSSSSELCSDDGYLDTRSPPASYTLSTLRKRKNRSASDSPNTKRLRRSTRTRVARETPSRTNFSIPKALPKAIPRAIPKAVPKANHSAPVPNRAPAFFPPWSTLPYHVLLRIFYYVAAPIRDITSRSRDVSSAVEGLTSAARTCRAFAEPALASLYRCPPFHQQWSTKAPHISLGKFIETLNLPPSTTIINYRTKVEILRIEVAMTLNKKYIGCVLTLEDIARNLPRLSCLELYHELDEPPYRSLDERIRWKYTADDLTQTLAPLPGAGSGVEEQPPIIKLRSWRWNARLASEELSLDKLEEVHRTPSFVTLRKVAFVNYQLPSWGLSGRAQNSEAIQELGRRNVVQLSACISALPNLEHLVLESSTLANGSLLGLLPKTLKHLELINCWEITANDLTDFLLTHGSSLEILTLNHCQSLSLEFLPVLGSSCPNLAHLYMDLSYFRHHEHYADNKPEYDTLLLEDQVPTWPSSMQSIEIIHMRKWSRQAAENFFESLMQSAPNLPRLRRLAFRVALSISPTERIELRKVHVDKMVRVFKNMDVPKDFKTLRPLPTKSLVANQAASKIKDVKAPPPSVLPTRRSTRLADLPLAANSDSETPQSSKSETAKLSAVGRELRSLRISQPRLKENDADDEDSEDELALDHSDQSRQDRKVKKIAKARAVDTEFVHGLCNVVDIQVDNHRPMEKQYGMDDFVDSEEESDSEWDGGDDDVFG